MYPEAGGASLFARRAFNEFWSFFTAWAQMLNYVITIAISAFFAAHYAGGVAFEPLERRRRATSSSPPCSIALLALVNVRGVSEAVGVNLVLAVVDFLSQLAIVAIGVVLVLQPRDPAAQPRVLRRGADARRSSCSRSRSARSPTPASRRSRTWPGEARDEDTTIPASIRRVMFAVFAIYFTLPLDRAVGAAGRRATPAGECTDAARRRRRRRAATRPTRSSASSSRWTSARSRRSAEIYVGVLAVTILIAATNAGVLGVSRLTTRWACTASCPTACASCTRATRRRTSGSSSSARSRSSRSCPGQADFLGSIYAFGAMLSFSMAHLALIRLRVKRARPPAPVPQPRARCASRGRDAPAVRASSA